MQNKTLEQAWIEGMNHILHSSSTRHVEDYVELMDYSTAFDFDSVFELQKDARIRNDYEEMKKVFFSTQVNHFGHNYANAIINPIQSIIDPSESISELLIKNSSTRKAILTFAPYGNEKIPCINSIQFLVRDNILNIIYSSRGQDFYRKFPCDAMCIASFGINVARRNGYLLGSIFAHIGSAHIYDINLSDAENYLKNYGYRNNVILTKNKEKYSSYIDLLDANGIKLLVSSKEIPEIQSLDPLEVVKQKAKYCFEYIGYPVWVDDISLRLDAYPLFPGAYTKYIFKQLGTNGLRDLLEGKSQNAKIVCYLCKYDGEEFTTITGENNGYFDFSRKIENNKMPLNYIFIGEGFLEHRKKAINALIKLISTSCSELKTS